MQLIDAMAGVILTRDQAVKAQAAVEAAEARYAALLPQWQAARRAAAAAGETEGES